MDARNLFDVIPLQVPISAPSSRKSTIQCPLWCNCYDKVPQHHLQCQAAWSIDAAVGTTGPVLRQPQTMVHAAARGIEHKTGESRKDVFHQMEKHNDEVARFRFLVELEA